MRNRWIDTLRFFSIFVVITTHFLSSFFPEYSKYWHQGISYWFLYGVSGKLAVIMFCVILGFLCARKSIERKRDGYLFKRKR